MIYLDTSVALAHLLAEDVMPPTQLWEEDLVSSRLLEYELWIRIHSKGLFNSYGDLVKDLLTRVSFLELNPFVLQRAIEPFPSSVRTLDALHLASIEFLRKKKQKISLATYDRKMRNLAKLLKIQLYF